MPSDKTAAAIGRSRSTVRNRLHMLYEDLGVSGRLASVEAAKILGWLKVPDHIDYASRILLRDIIRRRV